jgi:hypothetical protein
MYGLTDGKSLADRRAIWAKEARDARAGVYARELYNEYHKMYMRAYRASHPDYVEHEKQYRAARALKLRESKGE